MIPVGCLYGGLFYLGIMHRLYGDLICQQAVLMYEPNGLEAARIRAGLPWRSR